MSCAPLLGGKCKIELMESLFPWLVADRGRGGSGQALVLGCEQPPGNPISVFQPWEEGD